ncbi:MAG: hypothetical protein ABUL62_02690 [Myxococcales bacterium]
MLREFKIPDACFEVSKLPRRQQDKILEFLSPIVEQYKRERKAS